MDSLAGTSTQAARESPLRLLVRDAGVLLKMLRYLPWLFLPLKTADGSGELYMSVKTTRDLMLQACLFIFEVILLVAAPIIGLVLPGGLLLLATLLCCLGIRSLSLPMQGQRILYSKMDEATVQSAKEHKDERWVFINGCMTGYLTSVCSEVLA